MSLARWLPAALADIERLHGFLAGKNPDAARKAAQAIRSSAGILAANPRAGKPMPDETGRREWFVPFGVGGYVLRYKLHGAIPVIVRGWHSPEARETPLECSREHRNAL